MCELRERVGERTGGEVVKINSSLQPSVQPPIRRLPVASVALVRDPGGCRHHPARQICRGLSSRFESSPAPAGALNCDSVCTSATSGKNTPTGSEPKLCEDSSL